VRRLFARTEAELDAEKREGESRIGEELADLNLYHNIFIADANPRDTEALIDQLNAMDSVEIAYAQPIAEPAQADIAPTTPDLTVNQDYLRAAASPTSITNGIDALYARQFPGGRGAGVKIIDVEQGWNLTMRISLQSSSRADQTEETPSFGITAPLFSECCRPARMVTALPALLPRAQSECLRLSAGPAYWASAGGATILKMQSTEPQRSSLSGTS